MVKVKKVGSSHLNELFRNECKSQCVDQFGKGTDGQFDKRVLYELEDKLDAIKYTMTFEANNNITFPPYIPLKNGIGM